MPGYARLILQLLKSPFVRIVRGQVLTLAVPTEDDIAFCLDHMQVWLQHALLDIKAEFPDFEVAQAFKILNPLQEDDWG